MSTRAERRRQERQAAKVRTFDATYGRAGKMSDHMKADPEVERLVACALIDADNRIRHGGQSHYELRSQLGRANPSAQDPRDVLGFWTSQDRFVDRREANTIAAASGQCVRMQREMLSSDVDW